LKRKRKSTLARSLDWNSLRRESSPIDRVGDEPIEHGVGAINPSVRVLGLKSSGTIPFYSSAAPVKNLHCGPKQSIFGGNWGGNRYIPNRGGQ
jgi:hypothetical protein